MFIQMNTRFVEEDDRWKEVSRWVKFQENVEDGGKRWSKPFVPATAFSVFSELREQLNTGSVILKSDGKDIQEIVGKRERERFWKSTKYKKTNRKCKNYVLCFPD